MLALGLCLAASVAGASPQRIVSLNLCVDQLLLALSDRTQIASVSYLTLQPENSLMYKAARGIPANHALAEEVMPLKPDLVLAGLFSPSDSVRMLKRQGLRVEVLGIPSSLAEIRQQVLSLGEMIGRQTQADALVREFDHRLARLNQRPGRGERVLIMQPGGFTLGRGTLQDDILRAAGLRNVAAEAGIEGPGYLSLEAALLMRPQILVLDDYTSGQDSLAQALLRHPAWRALSGQMRMIRVAPKTWQCGTPAALEAAEQIVAGT